MMFSEKTMARFEALFLALFLAIMVRINFGAADEVDARFGRIEAAANGDASKQVVYAIIFLIFVALWFWLKGMTTPKCVSWLQVALIVWIAASTSWAYFPAISFRRMVLLCMTLISLAIALDLLGPVRALNVLYKGLAITITFSLVSVFLFPSFAVHPATESDQTIVGGWRGVFVHKNTAGAVCALAIIIFIHYAVTLKRKRDWFFLAVGVTYLLGSKSKTPVGLLLVVIPLGFYYRATFRSGVGRLGFLITFILISAAIAIAAYGMGDQIDAILADPTSLSGRVAIWQTALAFARDHFWLGAGYSSLWGASNEGPIIPYLTEAYVEATVHSHSGYIELLVTIGFPGLCLAVAAAVLLPFYQFMTSVDRSNVNTCATLFTLWAFAFLQNFMETQLYTRDREVWFIMLSAVLAMQYVAKDRREARRPKETPIVDRSQVGRQLATT